MHLCPNKKKEKDEEEKHVLFVFEIISWRLLFYLKSSCHGNQFTFVRFNDTWLGPPFSQRLFRELFVQNEVTWKNTSVAHPVMHMINRLS